MPRERNPQRTKQAILRAATDELAAFGVAGARVDRIAEAAGVNKRMIYHYFDNKAGLCDAVFASVLSPLETALAANSLESLPQVLDSVASSAAWRRIAAWEAAAGSVSVDAGERRQAWSNLVALLDAAQVGERLPDDLDTGQLLLALLGLAVFPRAYPQYSRMITGADPESDEFSRAQRGFQNRLLGVLRRAAVREPGKPRVRIKRTGHPPGHLPETR